MRREMLVEGMQDDTEPEQGAATPAGGSLKGAQPRSPDSEREARKPTFRDAECQGGGGLLVQIKEEQVEAGEEEEEEDGPDRRDPCRWDGPDEPLPRARLKEEPPEAACTESSSEAPGLMWGSAPHSKKPHLSGSPDYSSPHNPAESDSGERPHPDPMSFKSASESSRCSIEVSRNSPSAASSPGLLMSVSPVPSSSGPASPPPACCGDAATQSSSPARETGATPPGAKTCTNVQRRHEKMANLNSIIHRLERAANREDALEWEF